jgi:hypothetical protein
LRNVRASSIGRGEHRHPRVRATAQGRSARRGRPSAAVRTSPRPTPSPARRAIGLAIERWQRLLRG